MSQRVLLPLHVWWFHIHISVLFTRIWFGEVLVELCVWGTRLQMWDILDSGRILFKKRSFLRAICLEEFFCQWVFCVFLLYLDVFGIQIFWKSLIGSDWPTVEFFAVPFQIKIVDVVLCIRRLLGFRQFCEKKVERSSCNAYISIGSTYGLLIYIHLVDFHGKYR